MTLVIMTLRTVTLSVTIVCLSINYAECRIFIVAMSAVYQKKVTSVQTLSLFTVFLGLGIERSIFTHIKSFEIS